MDFETSEIGINTVNNNWLGKFSIVTLAEWSRKSCDVETKRNRFEIDVNGKISHDYWKLTFSW